MCLVICLLRFVPQSQVTDGQVPYYLLCPSPDDRLLPEIATFFIAGTDTTAHTMTWTLYLLAQHPEAEARLCRELDELGLLATPQVGTHLYRHCLGPCLPLLFFSLR